MAAGSRAGSLRRALEAGDPDLTARRIGNRLDIHRALSDLVENRDGAPENRLSIHGQLHAARSPVEQLHAIGVFDVGDHLGHARLGDAEFGGSLGHASMRGHSGEHQQIAQSQPVADLPIRSHSVLRHRRQPIRVERDL